MIESIRFKNFKALRETTLSLGPLTVIVGPNGSGKSTVFQAVRALSKPDSVEFSNVVTVGVEASVAEELEVRARFSETMGSLEAIQKWTLSGGVHAVAYRRWDGKELEAGSEARLRRALHRLRVYALDASTVAAAAELFPNIELGERGEDLAGVLDRLRDQEPERFEGLNQELGRWLPEFDCVLFDTPSKGHRSIALRTRSGGHKISAQELSQGTLLALAILTLAYLPDPPLFVGFEEPDRGIHPRLLRDVRDALYRLAYPQSFGETRPPVQVVVTTHSPYFLDLFKDHPEEIVIAEKVGHEARFERLMDQPNVEEILQSAPLGEVWYSGILGGVPVQP